MDMKINSDLIVSLRKNKGWSQNQLSIVSDLSLRTVQRVENEGNASVETLKSLAAAFETNFNELVVKPSKRNIFYKKATAPLLLFSGLAAIILVASSTTAAPGVEIQAESVFVSPDQTVTTFSGEVSMLFPDKAAFEITTSNSEEFPHQLIISAENATFHVLNARIIKTENAIEIMAAEVKAITALE